MISTIKHPLFKVLAVGTFFGLAWPPLPTSMFLLVAFVPLYFYTEAISRKEVLNQLIIYTFIVLVIRNFIGLYWIAIVSPGACLGSVFLISAVFTLVITGYQWYRTLLKIKIVSYLLFISSWVAAEWFCEEILKFPWMNLGFGLASQFYFVQWYEYTGIYGGTVWILTVNILIYEGYQLYKSDLTLKSRSGIFSTLVTVLAIVLPASFSYYTYLSYRPSMNAIQVVVVQTNTSSTQKFKRENSELQLGKLISMSRKAAKENTEYFIWPETALESWHALNEDSLAQNKSILTIQNFLRAYPNANIITGALTYKRNLNTRADSSWYNTALQIENSDHFQVYHKNILVPGTETVMFQGYNPGGARVSLYLGGLAKTFSTSANDIFYAESGMGIAPAICFESVFGAYISHNLVLKGAQLIAIISNDAWWGNSSGTWQHMEYMRLLAIENRRSLACASNGGISSLIDQEGNIISNARPGIETALSGELLLREEPSFYALHPDYIPFACTVLSIAGYLGATITYLIKGYRRQYSTSN